MRVSDLISGTFEMARSIASAKQTDPGKLHRQRSINWIKMLAKEFQKLYPVDSGFRVFSRSDGSNKADFKLNELLFDIAVCEVAPIRSAYDKQELSYVTRAVWQVESEFSNNSRSTLLDFSKLVMGAAENKLFIGRWRPECKPFKECFLPAAKCCSGRVFLAFIQHPRDWTKRCEMEIFVRSSVDWQRCENEQVIERI